MDHCHFAIVFYSVLCVLQYVINNESTHPNLGNFGTFTRTLTASSKYYVPVADKPLYTQLVEREREREHGVRSATLCIGVDKKLGGKFVSFIARSFSRTKRYYHAVNVECCSRCSHTEKSI